MSGGPNKVQASVYSEVALLSPLRLLLLTHVGLMLIVNEVDNRSPRITVIDVVTKPWGIDHSEFDFELFLLKLSLDDFNFRELVKLLVVTAVVALGWRQLSRKQRVDEGSFAKSRLACTSSGMISTSI